MKVSLTPFVATPPGSDASEDSRRDGERQNLSLLHGPDHYPITRNLRGEMRQETDSPILVSQSSENELKMKMLIHKKKIINKTATDLTPNVKCKEASKLLK